MEIRQYDKVKQMDLSKLLQVKEEDFDTEYASEKSIFRITFDKQKLQVPQILSVMMEQVEVKDVQIEETKLEEIVKQIYREGFDSGEASMWENIVESICPLQVTS